MQRALKTSYLARRVLSQIIETYPEKSQSSAATVKSLNEAITSLKPFEPEDSDIKYINGYLLRHQASDIACKAAWALYKDFVVNDRN